MSLANSLKSFQAERADAVTRNISSSRPQQAPARSSTPKPAPPTDTPKRSHDAAFTTTTPASSGQGQEIMKHVVNAVDYLKAKPAKAVPFDTILSYLSLPLDLQRKVNVIKRALQDHHRVQYLPKSSTEAGKESFKYRPLHPVSNGEELLRYLSKLDTAQGISVKELKDGWPDCLPTLDTLEAQGHILLTRNKKDNIPRCVYPDSPSFHPAPPHPQQHNTVVGKIDDDFKDLWMKMRLPASEAELRQELVRADIVPTSQVKEVQKVGGGKKKERGYKARKNGRTTNSHVMGILKDYSGRKMGGGGGKV